MLLLFEPLAGEARWPLAVPPLVVGTCTISLGDGTDQQTGGKEIVHAEYSQTRLYQGCDI